LKKHVKLAVTALAICTLSLSLAGCSGSSTTKPAASPATEQKTEAPATEEKTEAPADKPEKDTQAQSTDEVYGKITAVSGTEVTLALGTMDMANGEAPTGETKTGEAPKVEAKTGEAKTGEAPTLEAANEGTFKESGETITAEIDSSLTVKVMKDGQLVDGTIEDLTEDTVVKVIYDDGDKIIELQVMGGNAADNK